MNADPLGFYKDNKVYIWIAILVFVPVFLAVGCLLYPELFWDSFLWKYFWGPVVADAKDGTVGGVSEGYNIVNTLSYGIALSLAVLGSYELIRYFDIEVDKTFVLTLVPWIILGGSLRTLEDVGLFDKGVAPLFISPVIYLVLGILVILLMVLGALLDKKDLGDNRIPVLFFLVCIPILIYLPFKLLYWYYMVVLMLLSGAFFFIYGEKKGWLDETYLFLSTGTSLAAVSLAYNVYYITTGDGVNPWESVLIPLMALSVTFIVIFSGYILDYIRDSSIQDLLSSPLNSLIIFSHMFDASATYRGIEYYGYVEKHVLPTYMIELTGTSLVMFPLKILLVCFIIYVVDVMFEEELRETPQLKNLLKFIVIVLGMAPAVRNMLRLSMGV
ncbi:MAG: DUF63 family protein [Thermoplasmata archaeon]